MRITHAVPTTATTRTEIVIAEILAPRTTVGKGITTVTMIAVATVIGTETGIGTGTEIGTITTTIGIDDEDMHPQ